jgi:predicted Zn-dependent protease
MRTTVWGSLLVVGAMTGACATNPVTGRSELSLVSESQEISMGQQAAQEVAQSIGLYNDARAETYVSNLGKKLAALSERPQLPWQFHVVDDAAVNAFALPGGPIFVTRGIMTTLNSEAELAAVMGHEIGHVTAKHSVQQISRAQVAQLGLGVGSILSSKVASVAGVASQGLGLLFLKYGRDAENQADALGFKYSLQANYDVREMLDVFRTLERVGASSGGGRLPEWLSSHPNPENRLTSTQRRIDSVRTIPANSTVGRDTYLSVIDGMVYGVNPRQGFFRGGLFLHPDLKFQIEFPQGWQTQNQTAAVAALSPNQDALIQMTLAGTKSPSEASTEFFSQQGIRALQNNRTTINGNSAVVSAFEAQTQDGGLIRGVVTFLAYGGNTYQILGYTSGDKISTYDDAFTRTMGSFRTLTDQAALNAQPMKIQLVKVPRAMTLEQFYQQYPGPATIEEIGLINDLQAGQTIAAGTTVKRVTGQKL